MKQQLQEFEFYNSQYERPAQKWICGWAAKGQPCRIGPSSRGYCRATYQCSPMKRDDRWQCARPKSIGGDCEQGPLPDGTCCNPIPRCQPVRSIRAKRGIATITIAALTFGVIFLLLGGPRLQDERHTFVVPGDLTAQHAVLNCESCHVAAEKDKDPMNWLYDAVVMSGAGIDSERCLRCHSTLGAHAMKVHGLPSDELAQTTERIKQTQAKSQTPLLLSLVAFGPGVPQNQNGELMCATCHPEHNGQDFDLAGLDDARCQACHVNKFAGFTDGHPEFSSYPYRRRTRIIFNHDSHIGYFKGQEFQNKCLSCHSLDAEGQLMLSGSFENTCASCHTKGIERTDVEFLALPALDVESLNDSGISIGNWPADVNEDYEDELTPFMKLLMSGDPEYADFAEDLEVYLELDPLDLSDADEEELMVVERIVWGVKRLLHDLATRGHMAIEDRLETALGQKPGRQELTALQLSVDSFRAAQQKWLPRLTDELDSHAEGREAESGNADFEPEEDDLKELVSAGGWYRQDEDSLSLSYQPTGHLDPFLQAWLNLTGQFYGAEYAAETSDALSADGAPGLCTKCHSVDAGVGNQSRQVNWLAMRPVQHVHEFTHFVHTPHVGKRWQCQTCHITKTDFENREFKATYEKLDPNVFISNYEPMTKRTCAKCHNAKKAKSDCLHCHNYHIGEFAMAQAEKK